MKETGIVNLKNHAWPGTADERYKEILKLDKMLDEAGIYHEVTRHWEGWAIYYYGHGDEVVSDAIEHHGSYGNEQDLLEIMGLTGTEDRVQGWLTAKDVFERWEKHWKEEEKNVQSHQPDEDRRI